MLITRRCSADSTTTCASIQSRQTNKSEDVINGALITLRTIHRKAVKHIQTIELLELNEIQKYMQVVNKLKSDNPQVRELRAKVKIMLRKIYTSFIEFERAISKGEVKLYPEVDLTQNCEFLRNVIHIGKKHELPYNELSESDSKTNLSLDMLTNDNFVTMSSDSSRTKSYTNRSLKKPVHNTSKIFVPYNILSSDKENQFKFPHKQNMMNTRKSNLIMNRPLKHNRSQLSNSKFNVIKKKNQIPEIKSNSDSFTVERTQDVINSSIESKCVTNNVLVSNQNIDSLKFHKKANISLDTDKFHPKNTEYIHSNFKRKILNKNTETIPPKKCKMFDTIESVPIASKRKLGNEVLSRNDSVQCQSSSYGVAYKTEEILQESYSIPETCEYKQESLTGKVADDGVETMESENIIAINGEIIFSPVKENKMLLPENIAEIAFGPISLEEYGDAAQECIKLLTTFTDEILNNFTSSDPQELKSFEIVPKRCLKFPNDNEYAEHYKTLDEIHQKYLKMAKNEEIIKEQRNELCLDENFEEWRKLCKLMEDLEVVDR